MTNTGILLIDCPDRKGIVAAVGEFLYRHNANILHADQHQDALRDLFLMRVEWDLTGFDLNFDDCIRLFVSKYDHCLDDLLYRHQSGELVCDIPLIISNHPDGKRWADFYGVPFFHIPVDSGHKAEAESRQLALLEEHGINLVVLARY